MFTARSSPGGRGEEEEEEEEMGEEWSGWELEDEVKGEGSLGAK